MFTKNENLVVLSLLALPVSLVVGCAQNPCLDDGIPNEDCTVMSGGQVTASDSDANAQTATATESDTAASGTKTGSADGGSNTNSNIDTDTNSSTGTTASATDTDDDSNSGTTGPSGTNTNSNTDQTADGTADETADGTSMDGTATDSDSASTTGDDDDKFCADLDDDTYGDPENCDYYEDHSDVPNGWVNNWDDCDDSSDHTHPGAAENEFRDECTKDTDDDGYADMDPPKDKPLIFSKNTTDCNDDDPDTYPGAAENEKNPDRCRKDSDHDGWGDQDPPMGVDPGKDCDDNDEDAYPGAASNEVNGDEVCHKDSDDDDWGDNDPDTKTIPPGTDCDDDDEDVKQCMSDPVEITLANSVTIKEGDSIVLDASAMGGSGNYEWKWTPSTDLSEDDIPNPVASPEATIVYTVTATDEVDSDNMDSEQIRVYVEDVPPDLRTCDPFDLRPAFPPTNDSDGNPLFFDPNWRIESSDRVCQTTNNHPSGFICPEVIRNVKVHGTITTEDATDNDWMGFIWGMQGDADDSGPREYYLFSWRQDDDDPTGASHTGCGTGNSALNQGMFIRKIDETATGGNLTNCDQLLDTASSTNHVILARPDAWTSPDNESQTGWQQGVRYEFEVEYRETNSKVTIYVGVGGAREEIATVTVNDSSLPEGKFGFFTASQDEVCFFEYFLEGLDEG